MPPTWLAGWGGVGNEEYARQNRSYGLTTLRSRHVRVIGPWLRFDSGARPRAFGSSSGTAARFGARI
jgi:DNA topoisomerase IB